MTLNTVINLRVTKRVNQDLTKIAKQIGLSKSDMIRMMLERIPTDPLIAELSLINKRRSELLKG